MNIKEWIFPVSFAIVMTYAVQYYFEPRVEKAPSQEQIKSGSGFFAPSIQDVNKPLLLDVVYQDAQQDTSESLQVIKTSCGTYVFSNKGAVLKNFSFPWQDGKEQISTVLADENCFLLALEKDTPLMYTMSHVVHDEHATVQSVEYTAPYNGGIITKLFTLHSNSYQIDLDVTVFSLLSQLCSQQSVAIKLVVL